MNAFRQFLPGLLLVVIVFFSPVQVSAQAVVSEAEYRAILIELIQNLQKQILLLQAELERKQAPVAVAKADDEFVSFSGIVDVEATYSIRNPEDTDGIRNREHREYFERVFEVFPDFYDDKVRKLMVFGGEDAEFDAFVETLPPSHRNWMYAVNQDILENEDSLPNTELIVHELAHIISYEEIAGVPKPAQTKCDDYFNRHGCPVANSYLGQFVDRFWSADNLKRAARLESSRNIYEEISLYYEQHKDEFVSDYAVQSPEEDFAESFMFFVLEEDTSVGSVSREKTDFFLKYAKAVSMRDEILSNLE